MIFCAVSWSKLQSISSSAVACDTRATVLQPSCRTKHSLLALREMHLFILQELQSSLASYADALWARHVIFLPHERGGGRLRDEPKERLRRRLRVVRLASSEGCFSLLPKHDATCADAVRCG